MTPSGPVGPYAAFARRRERRRGYSPLRTFRFTVTSCSLSGWLL
jgi:hypothetical protein